MPVNPLPQLHEAMATTSHPLSHLRQAALAGTGRAVPVRIVRNDDFPASLQTNDQWIRTRTGIRQRCIAGPNDTSFSLGLKASEQALASSGLSPRDIDLIIFATVTPDTMVPSNACRLQAALGCRPIGAFDVLGACTGFVQGLTIATQFIATGSCEHVLVVGGEVLTRTVDFTDRSSCILFGDGGGAVILSATDDPERGIRWSKLFSDGDKADLIYMPSQVTHIPPPEILADMGPLPDRGGKFIHINGREVFRFAVRTMIKVVQEALLAVPLPMDRVWLVPHQVNQRIIDAAMPELPIPASRVVLNLERFGNTSAASVPIAMDEAIRNGQIGAGDHLVLVAFGGGMTWGAVILSL